MDCSPSGSSIQGDSPGKTLEWVAMPSSRGSSPPRDKPISLVSSAFAVLCLVTQWCPTLCDPMDCSPLGSSVHRDFQAKILEWVAIPTSRGSSQPRDRTQVSHSAGGFFTVWAQMGSLPLAPPGKPFAWLCVCVCTCMCMYMRMCPLNSSAVSDSLRPYGHNPPGSSVHRISPGKDTGVGCHFLPQGIFLIQGGNPPILHWQAGS